MKCECADAGEQCHGADAPKEELDMGINVCVLLAICDSLHPLKWHTVPSAICSGSLQGKVQILICCPAATMCANGTTQRTLHDQEARLP